MSELRILPDGWCWVTLAELIAKVEAGKSFKCEERPPTANEVGVIKVSAVSWGKFQELESKTCTDITRVNKNFFVRSGDFLFSRANTIELVGACVIVGQVSLQTMLSDKILRFHFCRDSMKSWILHLLRSKQGRQQIEALSTGNQDSMRNIGQERLGLIQIPMPPAAEQTRIIEKLDELFSDLDAGVAELKIAQKKLVQYRQSLLKAAVEGSLTEQWRKQNTPKETGAQLLERILLERRARWEAKQLAKFKEQGKMPPKDWQKKYPEPIHPKKVNLPDLPPGWVWGTLSQVGWLDRGRSTHRPRNAPHLYGGQYPFVQTGDIRHAETFISNVAATYNEVGLNQSRLWPIGTICITIAANIGKTAILSSKACFPDSIVGFLTELTDVSIRYVEYFMRSVQQKLEDDAPATAQKNINLEILSKVIVAIPPIDEQNQIVKFLDHALAQAADNNFAIDLGIKQSTAQRQNILRAAFSGQLVPQDPNDEPASVLLARIRAERAERAAREAVKKPQGRKIKASA